MIERFIAEHFPAMSDEDGVGYAFETYWEKDKEKAIATLSEEEELDDLGLRNVIDELIYSQKTPLIFDVLKIMKKEPKLLEKPTIAERIIEKIRKFVEIFIDGVD